MPPRAHWKGYLRLSLVSCPISLYPAISAAERIAFRQVNRHTGNRLRQQMVDSVTGEVVQSYDKGHGYEIGERQLLLMEDEELEAARQAARARPAVTPAPRPAAEAPPVDQGTPPRGAALGKAALRIPGRRSEPQLAPAYEPSPLPAPVRVESTRTIEIERFFPVSELDSRYYDTPYYVAPRKEVGVEAFAVIRDAMRGKGLVGLGRVVLAKRERPIIVRPMGRGLSGTTLHYAHEVRSEADYFTEIPELELPEEMLALAEHILQTKTAHFDPAYLEDRYRTALVAMLKEKHAALPQRSAPTTPSPQNVINLMDALKRSLETGRPTSQRIPSTRKPAARRTAASSPMQPRSPRKPGS